MGEWWRHCRHFNAPYKQPSPLPLEPFQMATAMWRHHLAVANQNDSGDEEEGILAWSTEGSAMLRAPPSGYIAYVVGNLDYVNRHLLQYLLIWNMEDFMAFQLVSRCGIEYIPSSGWRCFTAARRTFISVLLPTGDHTKLPYVKSESGKFLKHSTNTLDDMCKISFLM